MRGYRGVKYTLFIFCYFFWVVSAILTAVGIYAKIAREKDVVDTLTVDPALLLIVVGSVMFLITFLGCFGALRNTICLLKMFVGLLVAILLLQIAAAFVGYFFTDTVMERTERLMMKAIERYREDQDLENAIDFIQKKFQCCGVESYKNWSRNAYFECSDTNPSLEACGVPFSCCIRLQNQTVLNTMCGYGMQQLEEKLARQDIFTIGCLDKIVWWAKHNLLLVAGLTAGLLLLEVCMIALAAVQICWIKNVLQRQERKAAQSKSQRKESLWFPPFAEFDD
ncbi:tetraspanin-33 [Maylandia zebra]|uniref:Tetraspanin n=2 Tax=Haplochromini TaxID=319058 RepID=A0A3P9B1Y4_9CICH|nr:tetraspanin-33 [Maylandia zebra]XP_025999299.1 tetraspanin-33-like isoform X2 [Astatotilapia calliptera]